MSTFKGLLLQCSIGFAFLFALGTSSTPMACSYGQRGSLTVFCVGATPRYFRVTAYRFDHLDETLKCVNCTLDVLGEGTFDISGNQIITLDISNSTIREIHSKAFIGLIFVQRIFLSNNPIDIIQPGAFAGIRKVKYLEMSNAVHTLKPRVFMELQSLEVLILKDSGLTVIESGTFDGLRNLKLLDLNNNDIETINDSFAHLTKLAALQLQNNNIKRIYGDEFKMLKSLLLLDLSLNLLTNFTINIDTDNKLRVLKLNRNNLSEDSFQPGTFSNLNELEELDLSMNYFTKLPPKFLQGLHHLIKLNLNGNYLKQLNTGSLSGLPHLSVLNLSHNTLTEVRVSGNLGLNSLHVLDLSDNSITAFDYISIIRRMRNLNNINLEMNKLHCEAMRDLSVQLEEDGVNFSMSSPEKDCPEETKSAGEVLKQMIKEHEEPYSKSAFLSTIFVLLAVVVILVGILFYMQFFVLYKMGVRPMDLVITRHSAATV